MQLLKLADPTLNTGSSRQIVSQGDILPSDSISISEIRSRAAAFAKRWEGEEYERGESQTFWNEFLAVFGVDRKRVAYFEQRAKKSSGAGYGFIDLFWPGVLLVEQKSLGKSLEAAESQADDYLAQLNNGEFPIASIVSDFRRLKITWFEGLDKGNTSILDLKDLPVMVDKFAFLAGYKVRDYAQLDHEVVNGKAVQLLIGLYKEIDGDHYSQETTATFLNRILFLLFGDDSGLWSRGLFYQLVSESSPDGSDLSGLLSELFLTLDKPLNVRSSKQNDLIAQFPYVNGQLFAEHCEVPLFDTKMRSALLSCCLFDWAQVSPDIFGSLFQEVKDQVDRRSDGEHYTSPGNILKVLDSVLLVELRAELENCGKSLNKLELFRQRLGTYTVLDPACGCGNFLVVAYRAMRALELDALKRIREIQGADVISTMDLTDSLHVNLANFQGIELHEWPAAIAKTALFLADHQANVELSQNFGTAPARLPIEHIADIRIGNALKLDWIDNLKGNQLVIIGNPPFVGMDKMSLEQQNDRNEVFNDLGFESGDRVGRLDYVASWFGKAIQYVNKFPTSVAFVTTNSLFQGDQARAMEQVLDRSDMSIDFAHKTFKWASAGKGKAAVYCSIVGFSRNPGSKQKAIFEYPDVNSKPYERPAKAINAYLIDSELKGPIKLTTPINPDIPKLTKGSQPTDGGHLIVEAEDFLEVSKDEICAKYLRPFVRAEAVLNGGQAWCLWLEGATPSELRGSPILRERLAKVASARSLSKTESVRKCAATPYLFTQIRQPTSHWLAVPRVSSENRAYIPMAYLPPDHIAGDTVSLVQDAEKWLFAALQSKAFTDWVATFSGALEGRFRISPDLSFNGFPLLVTPVSARQELSQFADEILGIRETFSEQTLADLYDELTMPRNLRDVHNKLDAYLDKLIGLKDPTRDERAKKLLTLHHELVEKGHIF